MIILERSADGFRRAFFSPGWENAIVKKIVQKDITTEEYIEEYTEEYTNNEEGNTDIFGIS